MGVLYSISIDYFKLTKVQYARVLSTGLLIPLVLSGLLIPVLYLLRSPLEVAFNFQPAFFWLIPLSLLLNVCFEAFVILARNQQQVKLFTLVSLLKVTIEIGLSILLVVYIYQNWYSRALAFVISGIVIALFFIHHLNKHRLLVRHIDYHLLRKEFAFGLSGLLLQTAIFFVGTSDKFFVMAFFGKEQAGFYAVAATFATIQFIVCTSLLQYLQPVLFKAFSTLQNWQHLKGLYVKYLVGMVITLVGVTAFTLVVYQYVLKNTYKPYLFYFYMLGISSFIWTITNMLLQYIVYNKNKPVILLLSTITIALALTANYISSVYFTINWLCVAQIVINLLVLLLVIYFNKKLNFFSQHENIY